MAFGPIGPVIEKVTTKSLEFVPLVGPGLQYVKRAKKVTKFSNPVKATTYMAGILLEICGGKPTKYATLCTVWATATAAGIATGNPGLIALGIEAGSEILEDLCGD